MYEIISYCIKIDYKHLLRVLTQYNFQKREHQPFQLHLKLWQTVLQLKNNDIYYEQFGSSPIILLISRSPFISNFFYLPLSIKCGTISLDKLTGPNTLISNRSLST